jgi:phenylacetate-CoA ligase
MRILYYLATAQRRLYWRRDKLRKFQEKRLRSVVNYAYRFVPYYHEKFKEAGISPSEIKTLEDLSKLPIVKKDELRIKDPSRLISVKFEPRKLKVVRTSGSTGKPFRVYLTGAEDDWRKAIYMRANISCGQKPRDRWVAITAPHHFGDTTRLQQRLGFFARVNVSVFSGLDNCVKLVSEAKPDVLDGYSGTLLLLARELDRRDLKTVNPRIIFGTAELIDDASIKFIESVFDSPFYDQFGCVEVDRTAWQCPEKVGYHMDVDSVITQFVDSEGNEVSPGERGEIVYTSLFNYAMPLIRYSVGDLGQYRLDECPCGRVLPLMKVLEGRKDSFIVLPNNQLMSPRAFTVAMSMFSRYHDIEEFRIIQRKLDYMELFVKTKKGCKGMHAFEKELKEHFQKTLGLDKLGVTLSINFVDEIPLSKTGKLNAVVSEVNVS